MGEFQWGSSIQIALRLGGPELVKFCFWWHRFWVKALDLQPQFIGFRLPKEKLE